MSTAEAFDDPATALVTDDFATNLRAVLDVLFARHGLTHPKFAARLGISRSTYYRNLDNGGFTGPELMHMAEELGVSVRVFFIPVDELLVGFRTGSFATLEIVPDDGQPHQNPLPFPPTERHLAPV